MKKNFQKKILKNGMTFLFEKRNVPVVSTAFAVRYGGINEELSEKGISHFIEHMIYKGTPTRNNKQIGEEIEKNGGELNGFTDEEITAYWCRMPSEYFNLAFEVLSDMIRNPLFDEKEIEKERKVIFEELKLRRDSPSIYSFDKIQELLYSGTLGMNLIGTYETMNSLNREKLIQRFNEVYSPNNLILCVVGDSDFDKIEKLAEKIFVKKKGKIPCQKFDLKNEECVEKRKGLDQANLIFAHHVPFGKDKKQYSAEVLNVLMAQGMSSRLFLEIREKKNLAYAIKGSSAITKDFGYSIIFVGTSKENVEEVKELILKEFRDVAENLVEKELKEIKKQMIGQWKIGMEDSQCQMINLLSSEIDGDAYEFYDFEKNISEVKLEDVRELAKKASEQFSFFALVPD